MCIRDRNQSLYKEEDGLFMVWIVLQAFVEEIASLSADVLALGVILTCVTLVCIQTKTRTSYEQELCLDVLFCFEVSDCYDGLV